LLELRDQSIDGLIICFIVKLFGELHGRPLHVRGSVLRSV
jgi:hypothetical protein